jgi:hypothetical protein
MQAEVTAWQLYFSPMASAGLAAAAPAPAPPAAAAAPVKIEQCLECTEQGGAAGTCGAAHRLETSASPQLNAPSSSPAPDRSTSASGQDSQDSQDLHSQSQESQDSQSCASQDSQDSQPLDATATAAQPARQQGRPRRDKKKRGWQEMESGRCDGRQADPVPCNKLLLSLGTDRAAGPKGRAERIHCVAGCVKMIIESAR